MGNLTKGRSFAAIAVFGLYTLADIIIIIVVTITDSGYDSSIDIITRILLPLLIIPFLGFSVIIGQRIKRKKQEKWHQTEYDDLLEDDVKESSSKEIIKLVLEPVVFQGDLENQICSLCNKAVKEGHVILICPKCASLFHHDHLFDWLKDNPLCPVCNEDL